MFVQKYWTRLWKICIKYQPEQFYKINYENKKISGFHCDNIGFKNPSLTQKDFLSTYANISISDQDNKITQKNVRAPLKTYNILKLPTRIDIFHLNFNKQFSSKKINEINKKFMGYYYNIITSFLSKFNDFYLQMLISCMHNKYENLCDETILDVIETFCNNVTVVVPTYCKLKLSNEPLTDNIRIERMLKEPKLKKIHLNGNKIRKMVIDGGFFDVKKNTQKRKYLNETQKIKMGLTDFCINHSSFGSTLNEKQHRISKRLQK